MNDVAVTDRPREFVLKSPPPHCPGDRPGLVSTVRACKGCRAPIVFVRMRSGKAMPCEPEPTSGDWRRALVVVHTPREGKHAGISAGELFTKAPASITGRRPHWPNCPAREAFKDK